VITTQIYKSHLICNPAKTYLVVTSATGHEFMMARGQLPFGNTAGISMMLKLTVWLQLKADRRAVTALEYGIIAAVIVATISVGFRLLANSVSTKFSVLGNSL
jgi:Flp pilus assembly pilin Flp